MRNVANGVADEDLDSKLLSVRVGKMLVVKIVRNKKAFITRYRSTPYPPPCMNPNWYIKAAATSAKQLIHG